MGNGMAIVTITELRCETNYTIIAGGMIGGTLEGPRSVLGSTCPVFCNQAKGEKVIHEVYAHVNKYIPGIPSLYLLYVYHTIPEVYKLSDMHPHTLDYKPKGLRL